MLQNCDNQLKQLQKDVDKPVLNSSMLTQFMVLARFSGYCMKQPGQGLTTLVLEFLKGIFEEMKTKSRTRKSTLASKKVKTLEEHILYLVRDFADAQEANFKTLDISGGINVTVKQRSKGGKTDHKYSEEVKQQAVISLFEKLKKLEYKLHNGPAFVNIFQKSNRYFFSAKPNQLKINKQYITIPTLGIFE